MEKSNLGGSLTCLLFELVAWVCDIHLATYMQNYTISTFPMHDLLIKNVETISNVVPLSIFNLISKSIPELLAYVVIEHSMVMILSSWSNIYEESVKDLLVKSQS